MKRLLKSFVTFGWVIFSLSSVLYAAESQKEEKNNTESTQEVVEAIHWQTDFAAALQQAEKEGKPLLVLFTGTDWCSWCVRLEKEVLKTPGFVNSVGKSFVYVIADFPMKQTLPDKLVKQNEELKDKFFIQGFPTIVLLTPTGQLIDKLGYSSGGGAKYAQKILDTLSKNEMKNKSKDK